MNNYDFEDIIMTGVEKTAICFTIFIDKVIMA